MGYYYDLHCHTKEGSDCSVFPVRDMVHYYKEHGYSGFVLADHFSGNSTFPGDLPWKERVDRFYGIYETALEEAEKIGGIKVFFGMEFSLRSRAENMQYCLGNDFVIEVSIEACVNTIFLCFLRDLCLVNTTYLFMRLFLVTLRYAGTPIAITIPKISITTNNSTRVKPIFVFKSFFISDLLEKHSFVKIP